MLGARPLPVLLSFALGACATAAVESVAAEPEPAPDPAPQPEAAPAGPPATVTKLDAAPVRRSPSGSASVAHLARGQNAYLGRLELAAGAAVPEHQDETEEYIHVLSGHGTMTIDGTTHEIEAGTTVFMPANATVSFQNSDQPMTALQVFAGPAPAAKYDGWQDPNATPLQRPSR